MLEVIQHEGLSRTLNTSGTTWGPRPAREAGKAREVRTGGRGRGTMAAAGLGAGPGVVAGRLFDFGQLRGDGVAGRVLQGAEKLGRLRRSALKTARAGRERRRQYPGRRLGDQLHGVHQPGRLQPPRDRQGQPQPVRRQPLGAGQCGVLRSLRPGQHVVGRPQRPPLPSRHLEPGRAAVQQIGSTTLLREGRSAGQPSGLRSQTPSGVLAFEQVAYINSPTDKAWDLAVGCSLTCFHGSPAGDRRHREELHRHGPGVHERWPGRKPWPYAVPAFRGVVAALVLGAALTACSDGHVVSSDSQQLYLKVPSSWTVFEQHDLAKDGAFRSLFTSAPIFAAIAFGTRHARPGRRLHADPLPVGHRRGPPAQRRASSRRCR